MKKISVTRDTLYELYIIQQLTSYQIADVLGISASTVRNKLKSFDITPELQRLHIPSIETSKLQNDVLIGSVLGDGSFKRASENSNCYLSISHAEDQKEYCISKFNILKNLCNAETVSFYDRSKDKDGKKRQDQFRFTSKSLPCLNTYASMTILQTLSLLNENSLTIWFMDDGNHNKNVNSFYELTAARFTEEEIDYAIKVFKDKFDLDAHKRNDKRYGTGGFSFNTYDSYALSQLMRKSEVGQLIYDSIPYKFINQITLNRVVKAEKFKVPLEH